MRFLSESSEMVATTGLAGAASCFLVALLLAATALPQASEASCVFVCDESLFAAVFMHIHMHTPAYKQFCYHLVNSCASSSFSPSRMQTGHDKAWPWSHGHAPPSPVSSPPILFMIPPMMLAVRVLLQVLCTHCFFRQRPRRPRRPSPPLAFGWMELVLRVVSTA